MTVQIPHAFYPAYVDGKSLTSAAMKFSLFVSFTKRTDASSPAFFSYSLASSAGPLSPVFWEGLALRIPFLR